MKKTSSLGLCPTGFPCRKADCRAWSEEKQECKIILACDALLNRTAGIVEITPVLKKAEKKR